MKTIEELKEMTNEELVALMQKAEEELKAKQDGLDYWYSRAKKLEENYTAVCNAIKAIAVIINK